MPRQPVFRHAMSPGLSLRQRDFLPPVWLLLPGRGRCRAEWGVGHREHDVCLILGQSASWRLVPDTNTHHPITRKQWPCAEHWQKVSVPGRRLYLPAVGAVPPLGDPGSRRLCRLRSESARSGGQSGVHMAAREPTSTEIISWLAETAPAVASVYTERPGVGNGRQRARCPVRARLSLPNARVTAAANSFSVSSSAAAAADASGECPRPARRWRRGDGVMMGRAAHLWLGPPRQVWRTSSIHPWLPSEPSRRT